MELALKALAFSKHVLSMKAGPSSTGRTRRDQNKNQGFGFKILC